MRWFKFSQEQEDEQRLPSLLIDDVRDFSVDRICRSFDEGIAALQERKWGDLYLDHDLGTPDPNKTGYGICNFLEANPQFRPMRVFLISSNPVGRDRMALALESMGYRKLSSIGFELPKETMASNKSLKFASGSYGRSRAFENCIDAFTMTMRQGIKVISQDAHVATLAFSADAPPENRIVVHWASKVEHPGIDVEVTENRDYSKLLQGPGKYQISTDESHMIVSSNVFNVVAMAHMELKKRCGIGLTPEGRWGLPIRSIIIENDNCRAMPYGWTTDRAAAWVGRTCKFAQQGHFDFYNPAEYKAQPEWPRTPAQAEATWPDPYSNPIGALAQVLESSAQEAKLFLQEHDDVFQVEEVTFDNPCVKPKQPEVVTKVTVNGKAFIVDFEAEKVEPAEDWLVDINDMYLAYYVPCPDFNKDFWESVSPGDVLYHATDPGNYDSIKRRGLRASSKTRGLSNRGMSDSVFTSREPVLTEAYGSLLIEVNVGRMKADGYMPQVSGEEPFEDERMRQALAHKIGIEYDYSQKYYSEGLEEDTVAIFGDIPPKYLQMPDVKAASLWFSRNCKFAQLQQVMEFDPQAGFSEKPEEHPELQQKLEEYTPEGVKPEEWFDGFYHVTTNIPAVLSWGALKSRRQLGGQVPGLGGGWKNEASDKISVTHSVQKAYNIYGMMLFAAQVAQGMVVPSKVLWEVIQNMGIPEDYVAEAGPIRNFLAGYAPPRIMRDEALEGLEEALDNSQALRSPEERYDFMVGLEDAALAWEQEGYQEEPSQRVGFTAPYQVFSQVNPNNVGILQLRVRKGATYEEVPQELELRYDPSDVQIVKVLRQGT